MTLKKLFLIDSMAYIFRSFYAIRHMSSPDGTPTNAVLGFIKSFEKIIRDFDPDSIVAVFDAGSETFRNEIFPEYKANRSECPEDLKPQFDVVKEYLKLRGIPIVIKKGFEADDLIGTLAVEGEKAGMEVVICTGDKDMMQLVTDNVKICQTHKENLMVDRDKIIDLIDVRADQVIDYLAIVGDTADNVPGLPGIGPKGAAKILKQYETLETFMAADPSTLKGKKVIEAVTEHQDKADLAKTLVTIKCDVPLEETLDDLEPATPDFDALAEYFEKYGMKQMAKDLDRIKLVHENGGRVTLDDALKQDGAACTVTVDTYSQKPLAYDVLKVTVNILDTQYDLFMESGCDTMDAALNKYRDAFKNVDFTFAGSYEKWTGEKIAARKKTALTYEYMMAAWLYDSESAMTVIENYHNILMYGSLYKQREFSKILEESLTSTEDVKQRYRLVSTEDELEKCFEVMRKAGNFCVDTETTSLKPFEAELVGIGMCAKKSDAWYIPLNGELDSDFILAKTKELLEDGSISVFGQNIKYDYEIFLNSGITIANISFDTLLASYLINPSSHHHDLDSQSVHYLNYRKIPTKSLLGTGKKQITMDLVPVDDVCRYCCEDVDMTFQLKKLHEKTLKKLGLTKLFTEMDLPLVKVLGRMEQEGIYADSEILNGLSAVFEERLSGITANIYNLAGHEFNISSPKQVGVVLFEEQGLKAGKKTASGYSTDASVLEALAGESELVCDILEFRAISKLKSTYVDSLPNEINSRTGRIHSSFSQTTAATGRLASTSPNLQNIPTRTSEGRKIRAAFKPRAGYKYLSCDYSQIELRILAHLSEDPSLLKAFNDDHDVHAYTASLVFDIPQEQVTKEQRYQSKAVNFGIIYGQGPFALAKEIGVEVWQAKEFITNYFARYPKIQEYMQQAQADAKSTGYSETTFGRRRFIPEINHPSGRVRQHGERVAVNSPMQGTASDIIKVAMINLDKELAKRELESKLILQVHDELIFEVPEAEVDIMTKLVPDMMSSAAKLKVKLKVDVAVADDWSQCD